MKFTLNKVLVGKKCEFYIIIIPSKRNGIARLMMNEELVAANLSKLISTVYRLTTWALRAMSLRQNSILFTRMLSHAYDFSAMLTQPGFDEMLTYLISCNAFETEKELILRY